ncbi:MAG: hypothetical protein N2738_01955, partial [Thermodesulfovibrionales bacterium]|nr:hypothetical protein [Thermodesulfovibrionales bacterium]
MSSKKGLLVMFCLVVASALIFALSTNNSATAAKPDAKAQKPVDVQTCYGCHTNIKDFHTKGKHAKVNCTACHDKTDAHLQNSATKPETRLDHATCGKCHKEQYESFVAVNYESKPKLEKAMATSRSPLFDSIMRPHGFTREHAEPRSHVFMLVDHLVVDRAYGGRFQPKDLLKANNAKLAEKSTWEVLKD